MKTFLRENTWIGFDALTKLQRGWGNGYVALPKRHPYFGLGREQINEKLDYYVHGGLTFASHSSDLDWEEVKDMDDMWIVGWDTAHFSDTMETWPKERVFLENQKLYLHLLNAWSKDVTAQSNQLELLIDELKETLEK